MARIALIEAYPYEAVWGGDAVYLDRIRAFLAGRGHAVDSFVTDMTRGRSNPAVKLRTQAHTNHRWHVRNAVHLGGGRFCSLDPRLIGKALRRLPGRRAEHDHGLDTAEADWVVERLQATQPDLAILAFGACAFAERLRGIDTKVLALKGFFGERRIRLGEQLPTPFVSLDLLDSLAHATRVGFNNLPDLQLYARLSGRSNGVLVGMGFPSRTQPPPNGDPALLFVGARTKPNIESLDWFLKLVWPWVRSELPSAALRIAGSVGTAFAHQEYAGVTFLGFVDSLEEEYRRAAAAIAPLVSGSSGVKTKIVEALSFGRPVITTSLGVDPGDPDQYGAAVIVAEDPQTIASACVRMLADADFRRDRLREAREQFERHFTEQSAYREIINLLEPAEGDLRMAAT